MYSEPFEAVISIRHHLPSRHSAGAILVHYTNKSSHLAEVTGVKFAPIEFSCISRIHFHRCCACTCTVLLERNVSVEIIGCSIAKLKHPAMDGVYTPAKHFIEINLYQYKTIFFSTLPVCEVMVKR